MTVSTDFYVDVIVDGFQTVACTTTVTNSVVAKCRPGVNSSEKVVSLGSDLCLGTPQCAKAKLIADSDEDHAA
jgi:hypothetical protein